MLQDHYADMLTDTDSRLLPGRPVPHARSTRAVRHGASGVGLMLLLTLLECIIWLASSGHSFTAFLALPVHAPALLLVPLLQIALGAFLSWWLAQPLAILAYLKALRQAQESYRISATPLQPGSYPYDVPILYALDDPDPTQPRATRSLTMLELVETVLSEISAHLLLLGKAGSGKTMFLHEYLAAAAQRRQQMAFGKSRLPLLLPLKYYALFLQMAEQEEASAGSSLLDFLAAFTLPGLEHLLPYLKRLFRQGRLLFLCDGLDEVPELYRAPLERELIALLRQNRNGLLLTCTPQVYEHTPELVQAIGENLVPRADFLPLGLEEMRTIVERFLIEMDASYHPNLPTAGQIMTLLTSTRLRFICTAPLYLFALLEVLDTHSIEEIRAIDTRGQLLHAALRSYQEDTTRAGMLLPEDLLFLRDVACMARWNEDNALLCLPPESFLALTTTGDERAIQHALGNWAREQQVRSPFVLDASSALAETFAPAQASALLQRASQAHLITITPQGILEFRHPLFASALLAEYLASYLGASQLHREELEALPADFVAWSEPFALWAGLLDYPLESAGMLAEWGRERPEQRANALLASLICLGVAQTPPGVEPQQPLVVPSGLAAAFTELLDDHPALEELATLFARCATESVPELYQALFPLLLLEGSEAFLKLLDPVLLSEQLFQRLLAVIDETEQELLVKRLVRALSGCGSAAVERATELSAASSGADGRLRTAAINILGGTGEREAIAPLLACLGDPDAFIARRAANALARLGPDLTLMRLLHELAGRASSSPHLATPAVLLPIIERFLNENDPARQLQPHQFESCIKALLVLLNENTHANLADREMARTMLVSQGRLADERSSGKITIGLLVQNLASQDDALVNRMTGTLKEVGVVATPHLLEQLEGQPSEAERVRILEVLASLRDERALPALLGLLADNSLAVQQTLALAFAAYLPACIPGLIDTLLHHPSELVATRAQQMLSQLGASVVEPILRALETQVAGRTPLLVYVLEQVHDPRAIPALIAILSDTQAEVALTLAVVQALGQFGDERAVLPLLNLLTDTNPLVYEGAINALSSLGELTCPELFARLAGPEKTPLIARVERVLLGIQPFPGELLLEAINEDDTDQQRYLAEVCLTRGSDAAQLLAVNLFHSQERVRAWVRQTLDRMDGRYAVPALLEVLSKTDPAWRELVASYLLAHPQEAIPPLVALLDEAERGDAALSILLQAGRPVLPALVPALDAEQGTMRTRACSILVTLAQRQSELLTDAVQLFGLTLPRQASETLMHLLTEELATHSLPALLAGLEDAHLVPGVSATLVRLSRRNAAQSASVLDALLTTLRMEARRYGAALTLVELGALAVPGVGALITADDPQLARSARQILSEIGTPAFPFLWAAHSDTSNPARREAARAVFRAMPTTVIADELVALLTSARQEEISMALVLLMERIHDEALQPGRGSEMLPALLEYVQSSHDEQAGLRILALLILLGSPAVTRALLDALYTNPQRHAHLSHTLLLLGQEVESELLIVLHDSNAPASLQAELAGILAMRAPGRDVLELALRLNEHGLWAGRSSNETGRILQPTQLAISLRALGGLLVSGHWDVANLQELHTASKPGSSEHELYGMLLGWRYTPRLTHLEHELTLEREDRKQMLFAHAQELLVMQQETINLQHDLDLLQTEHEEQHRGHEEKSQELQETIAHLTRQSQELQSELRQATQEKQALTASAQQATQEKARLQAESERWKTYSQQLEHDLTALRRPN